LSWNKNGISIKVLHSLPGVATQIIISTEEKVDLLLDCGDGTLRDLLFQYYLETKSFNKISAILISHEHFDHVGGLHSLLDFMHMIGREKALTIMTPKPSIIAKYFIETLKEFRKMKLSYEIKLLEMDDQDEINISPFKIKAFKVIHRGSTKKEPIGPLIPAVGYTIYYKDMKIVYSGDTGPCKSLEKEVVNADLAILEATWMEDKGLKDIHLTEEEAINLGKMAKEYILIHRLKLLKDIIK